MQLSMSRGALTAIAIGCAIIGGVVAGVPHSVGWPLYLAMAAVGAVGGIAANRAWGSVKQFWRDLERWKRGTIFGGLFCVALLANYLSTLDEPEQRADGLATIILIFLIWGGFLLFSAVADRVWRRAPKR